MAEAENPRPTEHQVKAFAASLIQSNEYKEILRMMKGEIIRKWANEQDAEARDVLWYRVQAVGTLEMSVQALAEAKTLDDRKEEAAKKREAPKD
jgi:hypothetical protein